MRTWYLRILDNLRIPAFGVLPALAVLSSLFRTRAALHLENLALRHQLGVRDPSIRVGRSSLLAPRSPWQRAHVERVIGKRKLLLEMERRGLSAFLVLPETIFNRIGRMYSGTPLKASTREQLLATVSPRLISVKRFAPRRHIVYGEVLESRIHVQLSRC